MATSTATCRYIRTSAQKAGLVLDQIRGRDVGQALATLRFSRKLIARDIEKVLRSAIANVQQRDGFGGDVDRLYVSSCYANQGPSMKRIRPAPMGRAFRVVKRMAHLTVEVAERPVKVGAASARTPETKGRRTTKAPKAAKTAGAAR
jgi:large subunit ribosomal protein L22